MKIKLANRMDAVQEYYFSKKLREIASMKAAGADIINLGIGSPDMMPHPSVVDALSQAAQQHDAHKYQSYLGLPELRQAMSSWYQRFYHVDADPNTEILPLIGSKEGIMHISMTYLQSGDEVLVPNPGYPSYTSAARLAGADIRYYDLTAENDWYPDLDQLEKEDLSKVKIMWVNYPHMPTGAPASEEVYAKLIAFGQKQNIMIVNDNPYSFILNDRPQSIWSVPGARDVALELNSLSKAHNMAGWRIGMLLGHEDRIQEVLRFKSNMDSGMFKATQEAAIAALSLDESWFERLNGEYKKRRVVARTLLEEIGCTIPSGQVGMFVWAKVPPECKDGYEISDRYLYEANVFITPGGIFGSNGDPYVRVSLCSDVDTLESALEKIRTVQQKMQEA